MKNKRKPWISATALTLTALLGSFAISHADVPLEDDPLAPTSGARLSVASTPAPTTSAVPVIPDRPAPPAPPSNFSSDLYRVDKKLLSSGQVGEPSKYVLRIEALRDLEKVRMLEVLPQGLDFIEASPAPIKDNSGYIWTWDSMPAKTVQEVVVTVRPSREGWLVTNTKLTVVPVVALPLFAGAPKLEMAKTGPATIELGETALYRVTIRNSGNAPATNVVLTDRLPSGLSSPTSPGRELSFPVGTINPDDTKVIEIPLTASAKGNWENVASLSATQLSSPLLVKSTPLNIVESKLGIAKTGHDRRFVFTEAAYTIAVKNDGNTLLKDVMVTDQVPEGTKFVSASNNGQLKGDQVEWSLGNLNPGEIATIKVSLLGLKPSTTKATAVVRAGRFEASAEAATLWEGAPGVLTEIADDVDPVKVGEFVTYKVTITNQSPHRELTSDAVVELSSGLTASEISKDAQALLEGQRVIVKNIELKPRQSFTFTIKAKAIEAGIQNARLEFGTGFLPRPSVKEETTYVY